MGCERLVAGPRCAGTFPGRPGTGNGGEAGAGRRGGRLGVCRPTREPARTAGERPATATPPAAGAPGMRMQPGRQGARSDPSGDGPVRGGCRRPSRGRAVPVRPGRRAALAGLRAAGHRARVETRPRSDHWRPSPAALWRPPVGGRGAARVHGERRSLVAGRTRTCNRYSGAGSTVGEATGRIAAGGINGGRPAASGPGRSAGCPGRRPGRHSPGSRRGGRVPA